MNDTNFSADCFSSLVAPTWIVKFPEESGLNLALYSPREVLESLRFSLLPPGFKTVAIIDLMFLMCPRDSVRILTKSSLPCCWTEDIPETVMLGGGTFAETMGRG